MIFAGCDDKYRIYTLATADRSQSEDYGMREIRDAFDYYGVNLVSEDSLERALDAEFLAKQRLRLCAPNRSDRLDAAVAIAEELGVDALVYSTMPEAGVKLRESTPCMVESLISLYAVDPPAVLVEATDYDSFIFRISQFDWETIVEPPPEPEEFVVESGDTVDFAGHRLVVLARSKAPETAKRNEDWNLQGEKNRTDYTDKTDFAGNEEKSTEKAEERMPWRLVILRGDELLFEEFFRVRIVDRLSGELKYDVKSTGEPDDPRFRMILTNLSE